MVVARLLGDHDRVVHDHGVVGASAGQACQRRGWQRSHGGGHGSEALHLFRTARRTNGGDGVCHRDAGSGNGQRKFGFRVLTRSGTAAGSRHILIKAAADVMPPEGAWEADAITGGVGKVTCF